MDIRKIFGKGGNGSPGKGLVDVAPVCEGCSLFIPNPQDPPSDADLPLAIAEALQKWMVSQPVRVRETLPIIRDGSMIGLFVWWDRHHP